MRGAAGKVETKGVRGSEVNKGHAGFASGLGKIFRKRALGGNNSKLVLRNFKACINL